jgi:hypothetical protein
MSPFQALIVLIAGLITGLIGYLVGKRAGRGSTGFWLGSLLSLIGVAIITIIALVPSDASEEAKVRKETERLRIQQEAQRRLDAEREGQP